VSGLDVTSLFCGGGGDAEGLEQIPGVAVSQAVNHWPLAVATHQANHPNTAHDCADISQIDPRRYQRTALAWMSPDCTQHTKATGRKRDLLAHTSDGHTLPTDPGERSRATMWDVVRFSEHHQYDAVIVENVIDVTSWRPFGAWLMSMESIGYQHEMVWMSSAHASAGGPAAATNRNRWYAVFTKAGTVKPDLAKWTSPHGLCASCGHWGRLVKWWKKGSAAAGGEFNRQYLFRCASCTSITAPRITPASGAINWLDRGQPLTRMRAANTMRKIQLGLAKHAVDGMAMPFIVEMRGGGSTTRAISDPMSTITAQGNHHALFVPPGYDPITGTGSLPLADVRLSECTYRVVSSHERKLASAFPAGYQLLGRDEDQVRLIGNAVTPNAARVLGAAVVEALTGSVNLSADSALELAA
jgi:DNA (cytosine-5)-methyltransferase 1